MWSQKINKKTTITTTKKNQCEVILFCLYHYSNEYECTLWILNIFHSCNGICWISSQPFISLLLCVNKNLYIIKNKKTQVKIMKCDNTFHMPDALHWSTFYCKENSQVRRPGPYYIKEKKRMGEWPTCRRAAPLPRFSSQRPTALSFLTSASCLSAMLSLCLTSPIGMAPFYLD